MNSGYDAVATEYYNPIFHPTCANFDQLSRRYLHSRLQGIVKSGITIADIGAGRSIAAQILGVSVSVDLLLVDSSPEMLSHSEQYLGENVRFYLADAQETGLADSSVDIVIASLADPFNTLKFWKEIRRLLIPEGLCLFTTPAVEWAEAFRLSDKYNQAEFMLQDGTIVFVPSIVLAVKEQCELIREAGLHIREIKEYSVSDLTGPISPKLLMKSVGRSLVILRGFTVERA